MRILLVEDDAMLGASVRRALERAGYGVDWATTGEEGVAALEAGGYSLALLDLALPVMSGIEALREARARRVTTPVIIVTAKGRLDQRIEGLDAGADDYLIKPFDLDELLARIRAQIRRADHRTSDIVEVADIRFDLKARSVTKGDHAVPLTEKELRVLTVLIQRPGKLVSKSELEGSLYDDSAVVESNTVEVAIYNLRKKLGAALIITVRGLGYMISK